MPPALAQTLHKVDSLMGSGSFQEALSLLEAHSSGFPPSEHTSLRRSICLSKLSRVLEAIFWARHALHLNLGNVPAMSLLSQLVALPETRWVRFFIQNPVDLVLDVGANTGQFASDLRKIGYSGPIHSFEPVPAVFETLAQNASRDPLWHVHPVGIGSAEGRLDIHVSANNAESSSFLEMGERHLAAAPQSKTVDRCTVPVKTIDAFMAGLGYPGTCRVLKVDTQGYESEVLAGAKNTIHLFDYLHLELSTVPLYKGQKLIHDVLATCYESGFQVLDLHPYMFDGHSGQLLQVNAVLERVKSTVATESPGETISGADPQAVAAEGVPNSLIAQAVDKLNHGSLEDARAIALQLAISQPENCLFQNLLGTIAERAADYTTALGHYSRSIELNPGHAQAFTRRAIILTRSSLGDAPAPLTADPARPCVSMTSLGALGRFGNQIIQYAVLRLYAEHADATAVCPDWIGRDIYGLNDPILASAPITETVAEDHVLDELETANPKTNINLQGFFSAGFERWRKHREKILSFFQPTPAMSLRIRDWLSQVRPSDSHLISLHIRRGDFDGDTFWRAPESLYLDWLESLWPKLRNPVLYIATDDPSVISRFEKYHPVSANSVSGQIQGLEFYTDHAILSHSDFLCVSPSTFSWTAAWFNRAASGFFRPNRVSGSIEEWSPWEHPA